MTRAAGQLPDVRCTPGAIDTAVTQANLATTICRPGGYTTGVRLVPSAVKRAVRASYDDHRPGEIDHLISLELGGSNDIKNLWPQDGAIPNPKDAVENRLHRAICAHTITLAAAQHAIRTDWRRT